MPTLKRHTIIHPVAGHLKGWAHHVIDKPNGIPTNNPVFEADQCALFDLTAIIGTLYSCFSYISALLKRNYNALRMQILINGANVLTDTVLEKYLTKQHRTQRHRLGYETLVVDRRSNKAPPSTHVYSRGPISTRKKN